ncbi:hypothetical protein MCOR25_006034 [Pyricularia grisea]|uniref:Rhodopsin domain-containing protein n=1 Tax=Pyricularia grisea TaxID=148305 RepID=A0A6P8BLT3_PYRGI|nr:uncharacterized protein PgNI_01693 [Pyricularia grisea]KAI6363091.1 hypothetical protein MCOR25_006034 [Pyricularia grisea]TLD17600.1 hypothetical protein PgNI_01693 [Pyricularia grisea]
MAEDGTSPGFPPPISNPADDEGPRILAATLTTCIAAFITVSARCYVRCFMIRSFGWDDALMLFALIVSVGSQGVVISEVHHGAGRHNGDIPAEDFEIGMMLNYITQITYLVAICFVKLSLGASLLRIATTKFYRWLIQGLFGFTAIYTAISVITIFAQCSDIRMNWDSTIPRQCWGQDILKGLGYTNSIIGIITDLCFALFIPIPMLWNLNVTRRTRLTLYAILGLGAFACSAAVVKITFLGDYGKMGDWMYDSANITIWWVVECNVGIAAGSLPTLRPLFSRFLGSVYGANSRMSGNKGSTIATDKGKSLASATRPGRNWQPLGSSVSGPAETGSQSDLHFAKDEDTFEMSNKYGFGGTTFAARDSSVESVDGDGIRKTTVTEVSYSRPH